MNCTPCIHFKLVKTLTLLLILALSACSYFQQQDPSYSDTCINHAYTQLVIEDYITKRFHSKAPVRLGIVPFSVPENFASNGVKEPGLDVALAWQIQAKLLKEGQLPIVEVFNRIDWPGKAEEFYAGNFGSLTMARSAGYDLVMVGSVPNPGNLTKLKAYSKIIEVDSGITIWYGESQVNNYDPNLLPPSNWWWWYGTKRPDKINTTTVTNDLSSCIVSGVLFDEPTPE